MYDDETAAFTVRFCDILGLEVMSGRSLRQFSIYSSRRLGAA